jgi:hypothetical protein
MVPFRSEFRGQVDGRQVFQSGFERFMSRLQCAGGQDGSTFEPTGIHQGDQALQRSQDHGFLPRLQIVEGLHFI